jgi:hypothetical protein
MKEPGLGKLRYQFPSCNSDTDARFFGFPSDDPAGGEAEWSKDGQSLDNLIALALSKAEGWSAPLPSLIIPKAYRASALGECTYVASWLAC